MGQYLIMKFGVALLIASAEGFSFVSKSSRTFDTSLFSTGVYYSTSTGNTETVAGYIAEAVGGVEIEDIGDASNEEVQGHDSLIVGAPTWHTGADEQRSGTAWDDWLYDTLPNLDLMERRLRYLVLEINNLIVTTTAMLL